MLEKILLSYCHSVRYIVFIIGRSVSFLMPLLAGIVAYEVFARYFLNAPTIWAYDTSLFIFGYISALGGAYAQKKRAHINVDVVYLRAPKIVRRIFNVITIILAVGFLVVMVYMCFDKFIESVEFNYRRQSEWAPNVHHFWLMMTISGIIFIAEYTVQFIVAVYYIFTRKELLSTVAAADEPSSQHQPDNADTKRQLNILNNEIVAGESNGN